jgi:exonuclease III
VPAVFRAIGAASLTLALVATGSMGTRGLDAAPARSLPKSPDGEVVVISVNLQEAFTPSDVQNSAEMRSFARRIRELVQIRSIPYAPDVLLLQEVASFSTTKLARFLKDATGYTYAILIGPELSPIVKDTAEHQIVRDTAILINAATMEGIGHKGFITSRYGAPESRNAAKPRWKQQAFAAVQEKSGGFGLALASIHFTSTEEMASEATAFARKGRWADAIARHLAETFPKQHTRVIGGHFNNRRCTTKTADPPEQVDCDPPGPGGETPFWTALTQAVAPFRYLDSIFALHSATDASLKDQYRKGSGYTKKRIDFLFARARVVLASHDTTYGARQGDPDFISEHRLVWAQLQRRGT